MLADSENHLLEAFQKGVSNFDDTLIKSARFPTQFLPFISLKKSCLSEADFRHSILPGANFSGAILRRATFEHANLLAADLSWADLYQTNLGNVLMAHARLIGADLSGANLEGASLANADLSSANLRNANLKGANLKGANLCKANLFGARIEPRALADARLEFTVMPNGECQTQLSTNQKESIPVLNLISYTRIANLLQNRRLAFDQPLAQESTGISSKALVEEPSLDQDELPQRDRAGQIQFQFSEQSGDLNLAIIYPNLDQD
jgi:uncharacterized protein YjbI with pentapeptide repeats